MKVFANVLKILAALAAVAGAIYAIATYGDKIVAWAKGLMEKCPTCDEKDDTPEAPTEEAEESPAENSHAEESAAEEAPTEGVSQESAADDTAPVADDVDFQG